MSGMGKSMKPIMISNNDGYMMKNNIFDFATKELSQDAVICWILNWLNDRNSPLYPLAVSMMDAMGQPYASQVNRIKVFRQYKSMDVLIVVPEINKVVMIEDKIYSSEHDDQLERYRRTLKNLEQSDIRELGLSSTLNDSDITIVYFKTGFFYDADIILKTSGKADVIITGDQFLEIIEPYHGKDEILDYYIDHLKDIIGWYEDHEDYTAKERDGSWFVDRYEFTQYCLMRSIFPEKMWTDKTSDGKYYVYSGSSAGVPWTECHTFFGKIRDCEYSIFWRIDHDAKGPYISLRFYDQYDKKSEQEMQEHLDTYDRAEAACKSVVDKLHMSGFSWDDVNPGNTRIHYEAALVHIHIAEFLENEQVDYLVDAVRKIDKGFHEYFKG